MRKAVQTVGTIALVVAVLVVWWREQGALPKADEGGFRWIEHHHNDGDSFRVRMPDGSAQEIRLYFVDAPETALKSYANGENNHARVREQARELGLEVERTVEVGREAKAWVRDVLRSGEFTVITRGELVYGGPRIYGFVQVAWEDEKRWLHELLVEEGLVRIHTKGAELPDGTSASAQKRDLKELERKAKRRKVGAWR